MPDLAIKPEDEHIDSLGVRQSDKAHVSEDEKNKRIRIYADRMVMAKVEEIIILKQGNGNGNYIIRTGKKLR